MDATVIKIGGSLLSHPSKLKALCKSLNETSHSHKLIVVPGGSVFADTVRRVDKTFCLPPLTSHKMAILGMDQYGLLLSNLLTNSSVISNFDLLTQIDFGKIVIFLPSNHLFQTDPLENSWKITSDSIAAYIAGKIGAPKLILITDVDGIFTSNPKDRSEAKFIEKLSPEELIMLNCRTSVDEYLPKLLLNLHLDCFVVNGKFPERVTAILNDQKTICTLIH